MGIFTGIVGDLPGKSTEIFSYRDAWRGAHSHMREQEETFSGVQAVAPSWKGASRDAFSDGMNTELADLRTLVDGIDEGTSALDRYGWALASYESSVAELKQANEDLDGRFDRLSFWEKVENYVSFLVEANRLALDYKEYVDKARQVAEICAAELREALHIEVDVPGNPQSTSKRTSLSSQDIERIYKQLESGELSYKDVVQKGIGDCYYLATIMALTRSPEGRQLLKDSIQMHYGADGKPDGFIVTVYDDPMNPNAKACQKVFVDDVYAKGVVGPGEVPNYASILESAYGQAHPGGALSGEERGISGGYITEAAQDLTNNEAEKIGRRGGFFGFGEGYGDSEQDQIAEAVNAGRPVTAETASAPREYFNENDNRDARVRVRLEDGEEADIFISGAHAYTVIGAGDEGVTLANPWRRNIKPNNAVVSGTFTMSWDDFGKYYGSVAMGRVR